MGWSRSLELPPVYDVLDSNPARVKIWTEGGAPELFVLGTEKLRLGKRCYGGGDTSSSLNRVDKKLAET